MRSRNQLLALVVSAVSLHGCGGGGDAPPPPPSFTVGGAASGLAGAGLVLALNGGSDLAVGTNGAFTFPTALPNGTGYGVTVRTQPTAPHQTCAVTNGTGSVAGGAVANISVVCTTNTYNVSGTVAGLAGTGLVLRLNGSVDLAVASNGSFTYPAPFASGSNYAVTVRTQPGAPFQTCVATNASGVIGGSDTSVSVNCTTDMFSVGGSVAGLTGAGLVLQLNGGQDLPIAGDGSFVFPTSLLRGTSFAVTIASQTSTHRELCVMGHATGIGGASNVTSVTVDCAVVLGFVYSVGNSLGEPGDEEIVAHGIHPVTGALLPIGVVGQVSYLRALAVAPDNQTLYALDSVSSLVHGFAVDASNGTLTAVGDPVATGASTAGADSMAFGPSGEFLYVVNRFAGTIALLSIDTGTGALTLQGDVATGTVAGNNVVNQIAIAPDGAFLYQLNKAEPIGGYFCNCTPSTLTTYSIDATTGALTPEATTALGDLDGLTLDPLGRFLYARDDLSLLPVESRNTSLYPFSIDSNTGLLTPVNVTTTVESNGVGLIIDPAGQFAYLLGSFNYWPADDHVDVLAIDQTSGALTDIGVPVLTATATRGFAMDATGSFLFLANDKPPGSFNGTSSLLDGSTLRIIESGPTAGQLSPLGPGRSVAAKGSAIAVVQ